MPHKRFRSRSRRYRALPPQWRPYTRRRQTPSIWLSAVAAALLGGLIGVGSLHLGGVLNISFGSVAAASGEQAAIERNFGFCHLGGGTNCVVDGDTIWLDGVKIRVADIMPPRPIRRAAIMKQLSAAMPPPDCENCSMQDRSKCVQVDGGMKTNMVASSAY